MNGKLFVLQSKVLRRHLGSALCCLIFITFGVGLVGCSRYARVQSEESLKFIQKLYTACNTRSEKRLEQCVSDLASLEAKGLATEAELKNFRLIIDKARAADWEEAQSMAFQMAESQVR